MKPTFGLGNPNDAFAQYFVGKSYLNSFVDTDKVKLGVFNVTFEPGCRNNWHIHHAKSGGGQVLICTDGEGWYQEKEKPAQSLRLVTSCQFRQMSNIGMVLRKILGSHISRSKFLAKRPRMNGASQLAMKTIRLYDIKKHRNSAGLIVIRC